MNHAQLRQDLNRPSLTPDVIDDFVTWLTSTRGFNIVDFQLSENRFKRDEFSKFWKDYPDELKQYSFCFPPF